LSFSFSLSLKLKAKSTKLLIFQSLTFPFFISLHSSLFLLLVSLPIMLSPFAFHLRLHISLSAFGFKLLAFRFQLFPPKTPLLSISARLFRQGRTLNSYFEPPARMRL
jgi:hypothetical protein